MRPCFASWSVIAMLAAWPLCAAAADSASITGSGRADAGVISVNQAAGELNQQANLRALATSAEGTALAATATGQGIEGNIIRLPRQPAHAEIAGNAFAGSRGIVGVNQAAGVANQSSNQVAIAQSTHGVASAETAADSILASARAGGGAAASAAGPSSVAISDQAFQGASGIVQINQVAGAWNHTANLLAVRIAQ
jgi:hypothetical protein